jgi:hypothetical protein
MGLLFRTLLGTQQTGLRGEPAGLFSAACQHGARCFIRPEILGAVDMQQFGQSRAGPVDARFDGADGASADPCRFFV